MDLRDEMPCIGIGDTKAIEKNTAAQISLQKVISFLLKNTNTTATVSKKTEVIKAESPNDRLTVAEAADYLKMDIETLRRYIRAGMLKVGGGRLFRRKKLDEFIDFGDPIAPSQKYYKKKRKV